MALVTVQRSPNSSSVAESPQNQCSKSDEEVDDDETGNKPDKSQCFFTTKGTALVLALKDIPPQHQHSERRLSTDSTRSTNSTQSNNSDIQQHLQSMFHLLRQEATLKMAVKLESQRPNRTRYLVIASRSCYRNAAAADAATALAKAGFELRHSGHKITRHNSAKVAPSAGINANATLRHSLSSSSSAASHGPTPATPPPSSSAAASAGATTMATPISTITTMTTATAIPAVATLPLSMSHAEDALTMGDGDGGKCSDANAIEESCLLGIDCNERTTIGLVVPILADTTIRLDGDGGFSVSVFGKTHIFKPASVQAMWSALQTLHKVSQKARENNFYPGGRSHDWLANYDSRIESEQSCLNEWNAMDSLESRRPPSPDAIRCKPTAKEETESVLKMKLKEIMMSVDLDEVTSKYIRVRLEELLDMDLGEYKSFIDQEMLIILGQMDAPTEIFEHVYLGSEWNASNLEELQKNGVRHILNVTREIDNFFPGLFDYFNVRVYDDEKTNLLKHWDNTFRYITRAKAEGSKVLVHCKMGVSRSASVVIAYAMKAYNWEFEQALQHVKERRSCIKPNKNFLNQLETYRGMLDAMKNKEKLQRSKSETNLKSSSAGGVGGANGNGSATKDARLLPGSEPTPLIQALNHSKSRAASGDSAGCVGGGCTTPPVGTAAGSVAAATASAAQAGGHHTVRHFVDGGRQSNLLVECVVEVAAAKPQRRHIRRSSSTSPKTSHAQGHPTMLVMKQQSQSMENLTPERSVADEPKNVRFPGSNGENYSVSQNQVLHIQKNVPPPPPLPPPPTPPVSLTEAAHLAALAQQQQQPAQSAADRSSVRTIVHVLEAHQDGRKTADDRKTLNLPFGRSISHDITASAGAEQPTEDVSLREQNLGSPVWTSSAKLITQTAHLMGGNSSAVRHRHHTLSSCDSAPGQADMFSSQLDNVFAREEETEVAAEEEDQRPGASASALSSLSSSPRTIAHHHHQPPPHSRKTQSWAATSGGIVMDTPTAAAARMGSNSSIDSTASINAGGSGAMAIERRPRPNRQRDLPMRHASWGSGDQRGCAPVRNSSLGSYDSNRNNFQCGAGSGGASAIFEGQIHELNASVKTGGSRVQGAGGGAGAAADSDKSHAPQLGGTVKRTKQKLEECTALKKMCKENGSSQLDIERIIEGCEVAAMAPRQTSSVGGSGASPPKRVSNLYRSTSAAGGMRARYPQRCNSEEMSASVFARVANTAALTQGRASDGCRPLHQSDLFPYTLSDFANKNTLPAAAAANDNDDDNADGGGDDNDDAAAGVVLMRSSEDGHGVMAPGAGTGVTDQRVSGNVQSLKKSFEAKAEAAVGVRKGHQSLPSSPVAQHVDHQQNHQQAAPITDTILSADGAAMPRDNHDGDCGGPTSTIDAGSFVNAASQPQPSSSSSSSSASSSASSSCASSASSEPPPPPSAVAAGDRHVKVLVHKYQATTTSGVDTGTPTATVSLAGGPVGGPLVAATVMMTVPPSHTPPPAATAAAAAAASLSGGVRPRPRSYYENLHARKSTAAGKSHDYGDSRPPPAPTRLPMATTHSTAAAAATVASVGGASAALTEGVLVPQRRLQQHGKTHPLARLSLPKQSFNAAAYNTM